MKSLWHATLTTGERGEMADPIRALQQAGQSIWYDNLSRGMITSGDLREMVEHEGVCGVTANPATFEKAILGSTDYDAAIEALALEHAADAKAIYERLAIDDIQQAAEVLHRSYVHTFGRDGFVSLEVSPFLARDTTATVEEARRLFRAIDRENVMIKIPGTAEGIAAIPTLIAEGVNVNVTLLFAIDAYQSCAQAFMAGLERRAAAGQELRRVSSVASFFVSRIDAFVDDQIRKAQDAATDGEDRRTLAALLGRIAIANAKIAYTHFRAMEAGERWRALAKRGAWSQRLLWASTGTKDPKYPKTMYVEELIGPDTVNTMPDETLREFERSGRVRPSLTENLPQAEETLRELAAAGISLAVITDRLLDQGIQLFANAFQHILDALDQKRTQLHASSPALDPSSPEPTP